MAYYIGLINGDSILARDPLRRCRTLKVEGIYYLYRIIFEHLRKNFERFFLTCCISEPCSTGTYRSTDQASCVPCEEGTVSSVTGAASCTACSDGKQANSDNTQCG